MISSHDSDSALYSIHIASQEIQFLRRFPSATDLFDWSPDSQWVIYAERDTLASQTSYFMRSAVDGSRTEQFIEESQRPRAFSPHYSPDGEWIYYESYTGIGETDFNDSRLMRMRPDGSERQIVPNTWGIAAKPSWSPIIDLPFYPLRLLVPASVVLVIFIVFPYFERRPSRL